MVAHLIDSLLERNPQVAPEEVEDVIVGMAVHSGEQDGKFDPGDYVLFYAVGPRPWIHRPSATETELTIRQHLYDRNAWYFVKFDGGQGLRVSEQSDMHATHITSEFDDVQRLEDEKVNLLDFFISAQGAGNG